MEKIKKLFGYSFAFLLLAGISFSPLHTNNAVAQQEALIKKDPQTCGICVNENSENQLFVSDESSFVATNCSCPDD